jgi:hypothetical protein
MTLKMDLRSNPLPARRIEQGGPRRSDTLENARWAISVWWYLFGELLLWAQSQLAGYQFAKRNPFFIAQLEDKLGHGISADSHALEYIGLCYSWNHVNDADPLFCQISDALEKYDGGLDPQSMRNLIRELLSSTCANNSFWRFELSSALFALNLGQQAPLTTPDPTRRQGNALQLLLLKVKALQHVHFKIGQGLKKYRALEFVADELGQSTETLRSWEKLICTDDDMVVQLQAAQLAGELEAELDQCSVFELIKKYAAGVHRNKTDIEYAKIALQNLRSAPLNEIQQKLRAGRLAKMLGEK